MPNAAPTRITTNRSRLDMAVAQKLGISPAYVQRVRLTPEQFNGPRAQIIKRELARVKREFERFLDRIAS